MQGTDGHFEVDGKRWPITAWDMQEAFVPVECTGLYEGQREFIASQFQLVGCATLAGHEEVIVGHYIPRLVSPDRLVGHDPVWAVLTTDKGKRYTCTAFVSAVDGPVVAFESVGPYTESA